MQFLLQDELIDLSHNDQGITADTTVLDYLRLSRRLTGTKEGCASGDCGACTAVVSEVGEDGLRYSAINSCITFLGELHGKQLITVEHLRSNNTLHPVQAAMVRHHGSQCGFCTPGFVMSLFAMKKASDQSECGNQRQKILKSLSGNLCRCTGYQPIIEAGKEVLEDTTADQFDSSADDTRKRLAALPAATRSGHPFFRPRSLQQLDQLIDENPDAPLVAGGTDLALEVTQKLVSYPSMISLSRVAELRTIEESDHFVAFGAAVQLETLQVYAESHWPDLAALLDRFGSRQVRFSGTLGGNLGTASPIGDLPPVLMALNTDLILHGSGRQRQVSINDFFTGYRKTRLETGEIIQAIRIPKLKSNQQLYIHKISKRRDDDISAICMAMWVEFSGTQPDTKINAVRIACGGMAEVPKRARHIEEALTAETWSMRAVEKAKTAVRKDYQPISDARASAEYRLNVAENLLIRCYLQSVPDSGIVDIDHA
ncbi:MAG: xanthine dehydrogenase small subunit [Pseudomonadota bacterium]